MIKKITPKKGQRWLYEGKTGRKYVAEIIQILGVRHPYIWTDIGKIEIKAVQIMSGPKFIIAKIAKTSLDRKSSAGTWTYLPGQDAPKKDVVKKKKPQNRAAKQLVG
jgi:hypothetical protein